MIKNNLLYFVLVVLMILLINTLGWNIFLNERYKALEGMCLPEESLSVLQENKDYVKRHYKEILKQLEELKRKE